MKTSIEIITPEMAESMLAMNTINRHRSDKIVSRLAETINRGDWLTTHQGIAIAEDGTLLDGQHRLAAIIRAGRAVRMLVFRGCDRDTFAVLDQGKKRSAADALHISPTKAAVLRWAFAFTHDEAVISHQRNASIADIERAGAWFGPLFDRVMATTSTTVKVRTQAPVVFAIATRVGMGQGAMVLPAWKAYVLMDVHDIPVSVASFMKRLDTGRTSYRNDAVKLAVEAFYAFDPGRFSVRLGSLKSEEYGIEKIRAEVNKIRGRHEQSAAA